MHADTLGDDEPMATMNFIPLIDIALTLVIILMVTTVIIKRPGVQLKLPETKTQEGAPELARDLVVAIGSDGRLYIDGTARSEVQVQDRLVKVATKNKDARVLVKGDRKVQYERVMTVMDLARQAGLTRIILPTDPKPAGETPAAAPQPAGPPPVSAVQPAGPAPASKPEAPLAPAAANPRAASLPGNPRPATP